MDLPNKPSELVRFALRDLREAEKSPRYVVEMATWHQPWYEPTPEAPTRCLICLAGAVMAFSLGANFEDDVTPGDFGEDNGTKLNAINDLRLGYASCALTAFGLEVENTPASRRFDRDIVPYADDREAFHREMETLASDLEKEGY